MENLDTKCCVIEGQLEGLFRQLYSACTQQSFKFKLAKHATMLEKAVLLTKEMQEMVEKSMLEDTNTQ